jgi:hypothetical protein
VLTRPGAVRGVEGRFNIAYELLLTGATPFAVDVEQVEVRECDGRRTCPASYQTSRFAGTL